MYVCTHKDFRRISNNPSFFFLQILIKTLHYYKLPHRYGEGHSSGQLSVDGLCFSLNVTKRNFGDDENVYVS